MEKMDGLSKTTWKSDTQRGPYALIEVRKPIANGPWTPAIIKACLESMLFELTFVFFVMYIHNGVPFQRSNYRAASGAQSGNGSSFESFLQEVEGEADGTLRGSRERGS